MAKAKLYLDSRVKTKDGLYPLVVRISVKTTTSHINTGIRVMKNQFDGVKIINHPMSGKLNLIAKSKLSEIELAISSFALNGNMNGKSARDIKSMILMDKEQTVEDKTIFKVYFEKITSRCKSKHTKEIYQYTLSTLMRYKKMDGISINDINVTFIRDFEYWLTNQGLKINTISVHLRNIRAVLNSAIDENLLSLDRYPFRRFRIKTAQTVKRSLTIEELRTLRDYPCEEHQRKYRDIFMLSFYLAGINMVDLLRFPNNNSGRIEYIRSKTKIACVIDIPNEAMEIINRYRGENHLIFPLDRYANHEDFIHVMNHNLQSIGVTTIIDNCGNRIKKLNPLFPNLTTYWARHTWATIAAEIDIPDAVIDMALVHKSPYPMSDIYIRRNQKKVNEAIRLVIKKIKGAP